MSLAAEFNQKRNELIKKGIKTVVVEIDSQGGSVAAGMLIAKDIERYPGVVVCVVDGQAMSMALFILQSCDVRVMTPRSVLMAHQPSTRTSGQPTVIQDTAEYLKRLNIAMAKHITRRSNISLEYYLNRIQHGQEWYMAFDEAVQYGFVDLVYTDMWTVFKDLF